MAAKAMTANRLSDGYVVYLDRRGNWSEWIDEARTTTSPLEEAAMAAVGERAVADRIVLDPYCIDVRVTNGRVTPLHYREIIRAAGPTVRPDLGKQAALR